jgi:hypothetical protein
MTKQRQHIVRANARQNRPTAPVVACVFASALQNTLDSEGICFDIRHSVIRVSFVIRVSSFEFVFDAAGSAP